MNLDSYLTLYTKINETWIVDLSIKLLEEAIEENLCDLGLGKEFVGMTPKSRYSEEKSW